MLTKLKNFFSGWTESLKRFPLTYLMLIALTVVGIDEIGNFGFFSDAAELFAKTFGLTAILGLIAPLSLFLRQQEGKQVRWIALGGQIGALLIGAGYYLAFEGLGYESNSQIFYTLLAFVLALLAVLLTVAIAFKKQQERSWATFRAIAVNIGFAVFSSAVLRGGIAGTFASIEALFDVEISYRFYSYVGAITMIFINGSLFLTSAMKTIQEQVLGVPLEAEFQLNRIGRIFANYIILPLAMIYLAIFLAYGVKILIVGEWPRGVLVGLGMGYVAFGLFAYFLTATEKNQIFLRLHQVIFTSFYLIAAMMAGAIWLRIEQYGVTIDRYLVCALILAVVLFSTGMLIWKEKRILTLLGVVFAIALVVGYGPLSTPKIAYASQKARLETALAEHNLTLPLGSGSLSAFSGEQIEQIRQILVFFTRNYLAEDLNAEIVDQLQCESRWGCSSNLLAYVGIEEQYYFAEASKWHYFDASLKTLDIAGYSKLYQSEALNLSILGEVLNFELDGKEYRFDLEPYREEIIVNGEKRSDYVEPLIVDGEAARLVVTSVNGEQLLSGGLKIESFRGILLVR